MSEKNTSQRLVWAKIKYDPYWPACVCDPPEKFAKYGKNKKKTCVFFFGTKNYGFVFEKNIIDYQLNRSKLALPNKGISFKNAVDRIDEYISDPIKFRANASVEETYEETEIKCEPEDGDDNVGQESDIETPSASNTQKDDYKLFTDFLAVKSENSALFYQLKKTNEYVSYLTSENKSLQGQLVAANAEIETLQTKNKQLNTLENRNKSIEAKLIELKQRLGSNQKGIQSQAVAKLKKKIVNKPKEKNMNGETFEVDRLLEDEMREGINFFKVRWSNYDSSHDSWVSERNLCCPKLLANYLKFKKLK